MVSSSGGDCDRDAGAESTAEQTVKKQQANSNKEEAAVAAAPSDTQKVQQEERPEKEARKEKRSEKEVRKRKPAVAATSQSETVIDGDLLLPCAYRGGRSCGADASVRNTSPAHVLPLRGWSANGVGLPQWWAWLARLLQ